MSHFAELDENNQVIRVIVGDNNLSNEGLDWIVENLGGRWVQTSYNANFRKHFAAVGYIYSVDLDAFIPPQPYSSWMLNQETCTWEAPVAMPRDQKVYVWDETAVNWVEVQGE